MPDFYGTAEGLREYCIARNISLPATAVDDDEVNASLLNSSEWIDGGYSLLFPGWKVGGRDQIREWPRFDAFDSSGYPIPSDEIPREMINAAYEAAAIDLNSPGSLIVDYTPSKYKSVSVDGAISVEYANFQTAIEAQTDFIKINRILSGILTGQGNGDTWITGQSFRR